MKLSFSSPRWSLPGSGNRQLVMNGVWPARLTVQISDPQPPGKPRIGRRGGDWFSPAPGYYWEDDPLRGPE